MTSITRRAMLGFLGLGVLTALTPQIARAVDVTGATAVYTIDGMSYSGYCKVRTHSMGVVEGLAYISAGSPNDYTTIGARSYVYTSNGLLCAASGENYSQGNVYAQAVAYNMNSNASTTFCYADGELGVRNPYSGVVSWRDLPNTSTTAVLSMHENAAFAPYSTNTAGKTYGSALARASMGVFPDLIAAIGVNGVGGYVKDSDLRVVDSGTNEDLLALHVTRQSRSIPVYDQNGSTAIDTFIIG